ncbi:ester cyclase [Tropicibacter oceani]|uniref:Ester cyclase n=1 Tax=Tropicibacter oceani TaxID=3058420 RepID=A0ABY8QJV0_9RHOB|nr:ester cyclase [Tropicibacter oceani]WGW04306.1 ester cyclase [Tropicibacter oceani]
MTLKSLIASAAVATMATGAFADDTATVTAFYDLLSNPGSESHVSAFVDATDENWVSVGDYSVKNKSRDAFIGQVGGFGKVIPDLNWSVQDMHQAGEFVTVRSRASGTPVAPFFGVDGQGRGFDIMTIDIHQLKDGKIVKSWHVEDWAGALQQLSGK